MQRSINLRSGWEFAEASWLAEEQPTYWYPPKWLPATVPGCMHLDLVDNGLIPHPHRAMHEYGCQWVDEKDWHYRTTFNWQTTELPQQTIRFEGLDTVCTIWLNGERLAEHDNMFVPLDVDVTGRLLNGTNTLEVRFHSAARVGRERRASYFAHHGLEPETRNFDERAFVRKAQYMFGWDWGPRLVSCGIWRPVQLIEHAEALAEGQASAQPRVQLRQTPDHFGQSFELVVDGHPTWIRGANWIPDHSFPTTITRAQLERKLRMCKDAGFNMLRVWGGGLYESDDFYQLCDDLDILVWQDFPFACSYYPENPEFLESLRREATHHILRLRKHRCLALWCGNNENQMMWESSWGGKDHQPDHQHGEVIWNKLLPNLLAELDPGRPYLPSSPWVAAEDPALSDGEAGCNAGGYGDQHFWSVWHGKGDWTHYADSRARFCSEFGFASSCSEQAWQQVAEEVPWESPIMHAHNKTGKPWATFRSLVELHYPASESLQDWVYYSQLNQRDAMRAALEHYRTSEFCRGALIWQLNDVWPVQSWSLIDSAEQPKAAFYEMGRVFADLLVVIRVQSGEAAIWIVNDGITAAAGPLEVTAHEIATGQELLRTSCDVAVEPNSRSLATTVSIAQLPPPSLLQATFAGARAQQFLCEPKDLQLAPPADLEVEIETDSVQITTPVPLFDLRLTDDAGVQDFPQNYLTFATPGRYEIAYNGIGEGLSARSLAGQHRIR